jgi:hypothetical protein
MTDLVTLLGLPNPGSFVTPVLNPVFNTAVAPIGSQITSSLNNSVGPFAHGFASAVEQVTALIAQLSGGAAQANTLASTTETPAVGGGLGNDPGLGLLSPTGLPGVTSLPNNNTRTVNVPNQQTIQQSTPPVVNTGNPDPTPPAEAGTEDPEPRKRPLLNLIKGTGNPAGAGTFREGSTIGSTTTGTNVQNQLRTAVENVQKHISDAVQNTVNAVSDAVGSVSRDATPNSGDDADAGGQTSE